MFNLVFPQFWLDTKHNPADDPSCRVPVRAPLRASGVAARLVLPEGNLGRNAKATLRFSKKLLLEIFAGCARLKPSPRSAYRAVSPRKLTLKQGYMCLSTTFLTL